MPIDTQTAGTPGWWLNRLIKQLADRRARYDLLASYYTGRNEIPVHADKAVRQAYRRLMAVASTNFAELIVEAVRERMVPAGFRTGADGDELGDKEAWRIWQASSLDADVPKLFRTSLALSMAYMIVGPVDPEIGAPVITPEDPREVIAVCDPIRRRKTVAALKVFADDIAGAERAYVYLPGVVYRAARPLRDGSFQADASGWEWEGFSILPAKVVPVVAFPNKDTLYEGAWGEFETHLPILDRINYKKLNELEIATLQAFRQRAVKGVPDRDETGREVDYDDIFAADPGAMWVLPATAELWESGVVDLGPLRQSIRDDISDLAGVTRTPLFYLNPEISDGSAEGASLKREGLVFKVKDHTDQAGESLERVMALAFLFNGDEQRAQAADMEVIWDNPQRYSLNERANAASMALAGGMPWTSVMRDIWQKSPQEIERMQAERVTDALLRPDPNMPIEPAVMLNGSGQ